VHSLWEDLWKEKNLPLPYASDLRKRPFLHVDEDLFFRRFIHSLQLRLGDSAGASGQRRGKTSCIVIFPTGQGGN
jgi:hypothetical protein